VNGVEAIRQRPAVSVAGRRTRRGLEVVCWYGVLTFMALITVFPFAWIVLTALKGPGDVLFSVPPQFLPAHPTLDNFGRVLRALPIGSFFLNSIIVAVAVTVMNSLVAALAA
jgi:putative chitobiose transport system permease protein